LGGEDARGGSSGSAAACRMALPFAGSPSQAVRNRLCFAQHPFAAEHADSRGYRAQPETSDTRMPREEHSHARLLQTISEQTRGNGMEGSVMAQLEGRHRATSGDALRVAMLGANDGLVLNLSLVMGVAGAALSSEAILITGIAGLLAGAASMALGEWLYVQSSRELYERQIKIEQEEIAVSPEEERDELALIYQAKGLTEDQARELATHIFRDKDTALDTLAREGHGIDPEQLGGSACIAARTSFVLFAVGAVIPVIPFLFLNGTYAAFVSLALSTMALFLIGAGITRLTGTQHFLFRFTAGDFRIGGRRSHLRHRALDQSLPYRVEERFTA
jgi:vacuolar iron transporter family protein